jgi:hypothetical protein
VEKNSLEKHLSLGLYICNIILSLYIAMNSLIDLSPEITRSAIQKINTELANPIEILDKTALEKITNYTSIQTGITLRFKEINTKNKEDSDKGNLFIFLGIDQNSLDGSIADEVIQRNKKNFERVVIFDWKNIEWGGNKPWSREGFEALGSTITEFSQSIDTDISVFAHSFGGQILGNSLEAGLNINELKAYAPLAGEESLNIFGFSGFLYRHLSVLREKSNYYLDALPEYFSNNTGEINATVIIPEKDDITGDTGFDPLSENENISTFRIKDVTDLPPDKNGIRVIKLDSHIADHAGLFESQEQKRSPDLKEDLCESLFDFRRNLKEYE